VGRVVNTDLIDASAGGLPCHDDGRLVVDAYQQTPVAGVFALGDICSEWQLKHVANHEMRVVKHNLLHPESPIESDHRFVPHAVFTHPQIAGFGKTEQELRESGADYRASEQRVGDVAYGWALEDTTGFCKVLVDPRTRQLLGAHLMAPRRVHPDPAARPGGALRAAGGRRGQWPALDPPGPRRGRRERPARPRSLIGVPAKYRSGAENFVG
jgi:mycothione reductase